MGTSSTDLVVEPGAHYVAEPTLAKLHESNANIRGIMGPIGSGKSVGCFFDLVHNGLNQAPGPDGKRRTRFAVLRNTYPELKSTTIATMQAWFPEPIMTWNFGSPIVGTLEIDDAIMEFWCVSFDKPKDMKKLLSLELTAAWINEAREVPKDALDGLGGRIDRYPRKQDGGATRPGIIMDTNPPDTDHWWYRMEADPPDGWEFFRQPAALLRIPMPGGKAIYVPNPAAENVQNHTSGYQYWLRQVGGKREEWIKVYLLGEYGSSSEGRIVYPEYSDDRHCSKIELDPIPGLGLRLGWDYGRTPAVIVLQLTAMGQLRVLREIAVETSGPGMALRTFVTEIVKPYLATNFPSYKIDRSKGDPAGKAGGQAEEASCEVILEELGIPTDHSGSNDLEPRIDAVVYYLRGTVDQGKPAFVLDGVNCPMLRQGFLGKYALQRVQVTGEPRYKDAPIKNRWSHPHDALQYAAQDARTVASTQRNAVRPVEPARRLPT